MTKAKPSLPKLLASLAAGAKSVNNLPLSGKQKHCDNEDDIDDGSESDSDIEADDEFGYQMAFPEFSSLCIETRSALSSLLNQSIKSSMGGQLRNFDEGADGKELDKDEESFEFDDPRLWDNAAETCESLLERVDVYIQNVKEGRAGLEIEHLHHTLGGQSGRNKAQGEFDRLLGSLVDMTKPQITFGFTEEVQNSRTDPFCPTLNQFSDCTLEIVPGHGLNDNRRYAGEDIIAPKHHYLHPYQKTIETFEYYDEQLAIEESGEHGTSGTLNNQSLGVVKGIWIDTENELAQLVSRIVGNTEFQEIAIDLEAHSYRSFSGFVCTMQLSLRRPKVADGTLALVEHNDNVESGFDFIIDTLALRSVMNKYFAPIFANPKILKVMHGADSDVQWLQRDFGIYVVNLFDTGRASRLLPHFSSAGLAYLLKKYANVNAEKKHQLSDWRQRPLPDEMLQYAISDTMYLLDIYDKMKAEINNFECDDISIKVVLDESRKVCLNRYDKEPFNPNGYKYLINSKRAKRKRVNLSENQEEILQNIYEWRDAIARKEDESLQYVCPNSGLVRIASTAPENVTSLQACMNPLPPMVLQYSNEIIRIITSCLHRNNFKPLKHIAIQRTDNEHMKGDKNECEGTSKLGSKKKKSSQLEQHSNIQCQASVITYDTNVPLPSKKRKANKISLHPSNKNFKSNIYSLHSLEMKARDEMRGYSVDGLGAAKAVFNQIVDEDSNIEKNTVDIQRKIAHECALRIRRKLMEKNSNLLGLVKVSNFVDSDSVEKDNCKGNKKEETMHDEDDSPSELPKSIKEVYRISNRRERRTRQSSDNFDDEEMVVVNELKDADKSIPLTTSTDQEMKSDEANDREGTKETNHEKAKKPDKKALNQSNKVTSTATFDYSQLQLGNLQMFDPNAPMADNPFFEGVARSGGLSKHNEKQKHKRRK